MAGFERAIDSVTLAVTRPDDFIVLDEIGPLELEKREGFYDILPLLQRIPENSRLCVVIRPSLMEKTLAETFPGTECRVIEVTRKNRNSENLSLFT